MANKYNILFYLQSERDRTDKHLRCRVRWQSSSISLNVGYRVEEGKWNRETQRCVKSSTHGKNKVQASTINRAIEHLERSIDACFARCDAAGEVPTADMLRVAAGREQDDKNLLSEVLDLFIDTVGSKQGWSKAKYIKMRSLRQHLHAFNPDLSLSALTEDTLLNFVAHLQTPEAMQLYYKNLNVGMKNTTINRTLGFLRSFLKWANLHGYYDGNLHLTFHPHLKGLDVKTIIYLEWSELMDFWNYDFGKRKNLDMVRDMFCFSSFTALRFSDLVNLCWSDVNLDAGKLNLVAQKTSKRTIVAINKFSRAILQKYQQQKHNNGDKVFPHICNSLLNRYLKDAARLTGIDTPVHLVSYVGNLRIEKVVPKYEALTIHGGRRTFTVNALSMGTSVYTVKEIGGWGNVRAMKPYSAIVDAAKRAAVHKFDTWDGVIVDN